MNILVIISVSLITSLIVVTLSILKEKYEFEAEVINRKLSKLLKRKRKHELNRPLQFPSKKIVITSEDNGLARVDLYHWFGDEEPKKYWSFLHVDNEEFIKRIISREYCATIEDRRNEEREEK